MPLKLTNSLGRKKAVFEPIQQGLVKMYTCGPTVYDFPHIGNLRAYMFEDLLKRYLRFTGYRVIHVMNITDVDDKTIRGSANEGIPLREFTKRYTKAFFEDLQALMIDPADYYPRATDNIDEMVALIDRLVERRYAYCAEDSWYYDVSSFPNYGKLSGIKARTSIPRLRAKADEYTKDEPRDFALWKAWDKEDGDVFWETALGKGRPGWHIECSAMSMKYLGETFDIHAGGEDNIFPHHENEIAQSEGATGRRFVNFWLHCGLLLVDGQKMSKSLGNYYVLRDLLAKGYSARAARYLLLAAHYRAPLNFNEEGLRQAEASIQTIDNFLNRIRTDTGFRGHNPELDKIMDSSIKRFFEAMDDDLNTPRAFATLFNLIHETNRAIDRLEYSKENLAKVSQFFDDINNILIFVKPPRNHVPLDAELMGLIERREKARLEKDWDTADKIREELYTRGIILEDTPHGVKWSRAARTRQG